MPLIHQLRSIANAGPRRDGRRRCPGVQDGGEIGLSHTVAQCINVGQHCCRLRVGREIGSKFRLYTCESNRQLRSRARSSLHLGKCFVEHLGDVKKTDDIAIIVADRLPSALFLGVTHEMPETTADHKLKRLRSACRVSRHHGTLGHYLCDSCRPGIKGFGGHLSRQSQTRY